MSDTPPRGRIIGIRYRLEASLRGPKLLTMAHVWMGPSDPMNSRIILLKDVADEERFASTFLRSGDAVAIASGARSDHFACLLAWRGLGGVQVWRIRQELLRPLVAKYGEDGEARALVHALRIQPGLFTKVTRKEVDKWLRKTERNQEKIRF